MADAPTSASNYRLFDMDRRRLLLPLLLVLCWTAWHPSPAAAQADGDVQQWTLLLATLRPTSDWRVHLELQPRLGDDVSALNQHLTRWAIGRQLSPRVSAWAGHAWVVNPPGPGTLHEQRLWQQLSIALPGAGQWTPSLRLRLEQRFVDRWSDTSHRARALARVTRPLGARQHWTLVAWNELFVTLDETPVGPARGVDRNRLFGGLRRTLSPRAALETGYVWQATRPRSGPRQDAHVALVWLDLVF